MQLCNRESSTSHSQPSVVWQNQNHISGWILGVRCHPNSEGYQASDLYARPENMRKTHTHTHTYDQLMITFMHKTKLNLASRGKQQKDGDGVKRSLEISFTPWECKYSTVFVNVQMMSDASLSVKFGTVRALSSSSAPLSKSCTRYTLWPSSYT